MKKYFFLISLVFTMSMSFAQSDGPQYLFHDYLFSDLYVVDIIELFPDSTYTSKTWSFEDKKDWPNYKNMEPTIEKGRIVKEGDYYTITKFKDGKEQTLVSKIKLNKRMLTFYYPNANGKLVPQGKYKRIN
ncbi:hypothetical protein [Winogradskyella poriferorum]|uniref:hypothetical protein n=1 Tax=Winogradskyella poriferorum TaxID=307627 RepID=UPI003D65691F